MNCREAQTLIEPFIKEELNIRKMREFIDHIEKCEECRDEFEVRFLVDMTTAELSGDNDIDYDFQNLLRNRIADCKRRIGNYTLLVFFTGLVTSVLLILAFYYFIIL